MIIEIVDSLKPLSYRQKISLWNLVWSNKYFKKK